jgi:prepilin-type N-terminal cleavage/methylation domain-containing protein
MRDWCIKGFSLVELMVSMVILAAISVIGTAMYSIYMTKWDGEFGNAQHELSESRNLVLLHRPLQTITPIVTLSDDEEPELYFSGESDRLYGFTSQGLFSFSPAIFSLIVEENGEDTHLIYRELAVESNIPRFLGRDVEWQRSIPLMKGLRRVEINYFGWTSIEQKSMVNIDLTGGLRFEDYKTWFEVYQGSQRGLHPEKIRIDLIDANDVQNTLVVALTEKAEVQVSRYRNDF